MKTDPHPSDVLPPQDVADLPPKRTWFGYAAVVVSLAITYVLWLGAMGAAGEWYESPWEFPAKLGSHGTLILMCWAFILATRFRSVETRTLLADAGVSNKQIFMEDFEIR